MTSSDDELEDDAPSLTDEVLGPGWKRKLPLAVATLAPALYLFARIYRSTGDLGYALGAGLICPFVVYSVLGKWLDDSSWVARASWARWCANRSDERPLLVAIGAALVFILFFSLMWLAGTAFVGQ